MRDGRGSDLRIEKQRERMGGGWWALTVTNRNLILQGESLKEEL